MQRKIWICPPFRVHLLLSKLSSFNICISAMLYVAKTPPLIWNILGFLCWLSYNSVTILLSNKECLKLLLLSISSSRQCNGNVMVNLTQNGQWALSSPPLPLLLSKLLEMRRRFKFDWHKNNSVSNYLQSGEKQSSLLRFPKKSKEKSPLISMSQKVEYPRCLAWLNAKGALMITFAQSWLGFEGGGQARVRV